MSVDAGHPGLSEGAALELSFQAAARERRNRPRLLMVLGFLGVLGAMVYAWTGYSASRAQARALRNERFLVEERLAPLVAELRALAAAGQDEDRYGPDPRVVSKLETLARDVGLEGVSPGATPSDSRGNLQKTVYRVNTDNQLSQAIWEWLTEAKRTIPGLEVQQIRLTRGRAIPQEEQYGWNMLAELARWQRKE